MGMTFTTFAIILVGIWGATSLMLFWAAKKAPLGYQDETGFHFGPDYDAQPERRVSTQESCDIGATWTSEHPAQMAAR
jgi:hypothetical protein